MVRKVNIFSLSILLFGLFLASCSPFANLTSTVFSIDDFESISAPKAYLATPQITKLKDITVKLTSCENISQIYISETSTPPEMIDIGWENCTNSSVNFNYQLRNTAVGSKTIYVFAQKNNVVNPTPLRELNMTYAPEFFLGTDDGLPKHIVYGLKRPYYPYFDGTSLWFSDYQNNRVLKYNSIPTSNHTKPDLVLGHTGLTTAGSNFGGIGPETFFEPLGVHGNGSQFAVADHSNHRVLIFNTVPTSNFVAADVVLGQPNFISAKPNYFGMTAQSLNGPYHVQFIGTKFLVSDTRNNRVLIWNNVPTQNGQPADIVLGQTTMTTNSASTTTMYNPMNSDSDGTRLVVSDYLNSRILIWTTFPTVSGQTPDLVLGQPDLSTNTANQGGLSASSLNRPTGATVSGTKLIVSDYANNRVLVWNSFPTSNNQPSDVVIGQPNFTSNTINNGGVSAQSLYNPLKATVAGSKLIIADANNNRVLIFNSIPTMNHASADVVIGQPDMISNEENNSGQGAASVLTPFIHVFGSKILAADSLKNRVLVWNNPQTNNQAADLVLGQTDFISTKANQAVSRSASTLSYPISVTSTASGAVFVADRNNYRVLKWNTFPTQNGQAADVVLGQADFTSLINTPITSSTFSTIRQITTDGVRLAVADDDNHRVQLWNTIPTYNKQPSDVILGQSSDTANAYFQSPSASSMNQPGSVLFVGSKFVVGETNSRALIWNTIPTSYNQPAQLVLGQADFVSITNESYQNSLRKFNTFPSSFYSDGTNLMASVGGGHTQLKIWNTWPTTNFQEADAVFGIDLASLYAVKKSFTPDPYIYNDILSIHSDGYRLFIADNARISVTPYPNVLLSQRQVSSDKLFKFTARSCHQISNVLFTESTDVPSENSSGWATCSTTKSALQHTLISNEEGLRHLYYWYKDEQGVFNPVVQGKVSVIYKNSNPTTPAIGSNVTEATNAASGTFTNYSNHCNNSDSFYTSTSPSKPSANVRDWQLCSATINTFNIPENLADGTYTFYVWQKDLTGNISANYTSMTITIDRTPPANVPALMISEKYVGTKSTFKFTAADCNDTQALFINESDSAPLASAAGWQTCTTTASAISYATATKTQDIHYLRIWNKDSVGNVIQTARLLSVQQNFLGVLGQIDGITIFSAQFGFNTPRGLDSDGVRLALADYGNHRVLIWNSIPATFQQPPDLVLGQDALLGVSANKGLASATASTLNFPNDVKFMNNKLVVADSSNHRVLIWNTLPTVNGQSADLVLGQTEFSTNTANNGGISSSTLNSPSGLAYNGQQFFVSEYSNSRVLMWNSFPTISKQPADLVLGQPNFSSSTANNGGISGATLNLPYGLLAFGTDKLAVADYNNNRVLIWNNIPTTNSQSADLSLGQPDLASSTINNGGTSALSLNRPVHLATDNTRLFVTDLSNHRTLVWNTFPTVQRQAADIVIGQANFSTTSVGTASTATNASWGIAYAAGKLFIAESVNHRISVRNSLPASHASAADYVLGQPAFAENAVNRMAPSNITADTLRDPSSVFTDNSYSLVVDSNNNRVLLWNNNQVSGTADVIVGQPNSGSTTGAVTQSSLNIPTDAIIVGSKMIVADNINSRILIWNTIPTTNNQSADVVLGQSLFTTNTGNNGGVSSTSLNRPTSLASDGNILVATDTANNRILIWNSIPTNNKQAADVVLGQSLFTTNTANNGGRSASTLSSPAGVLINAGKLIVADSANHRVLVWNSLPTISGTPADTVIGQADMITGGASSADSRMNSPYGLTVLNNRLYISENTNNRIQVWDSIPTENNQKSTHIIGQNSKVSGTANQNELSGYSLSRPKGISGCGSQLCITDTNNHRILKINLNID